VCAHCAIDQRGTSPCRGNWSVAFEIAYIQSNCFGKEAADVQMIEPFGFAAVGIGGKMPVAVSGYLNPERTGF